MEEHTYEIFREAIIYSQPRQPVSSSLTYDENRQTNSIHIRVVYIRTKFLC